ncbi:hypothetical protein T265_05321 [Opisthorchis viverrini]|uniref:Uncharacterized protein n=1 Tax=Opisthorchis viverrini TaxID=6198 RepID=A0A074ZK57_OPIVI|nr:hypothetical protein T265_05321 [Opisthorchis viverrini]KER27693.1 hypothetical protein T265_05321 [Opisthorchis viverrini]
MLQLRIPKSQQPFDAIPPEGCKRAGILPGFPGLGRKSREAEVRFEPRIFRSVNSPSNHLIHINWRCAISDDLQKGINNIPGTIKPSPPLLSSYVDFTSQDESDALQWRKNWGA